LSYIYLSYAKAADPQEKKALAAAPTFGLYSGWLIYCSVVNIAAALVK
jgi:hypothetical protein